MGKTAETLTKTQERLFQSGTNSNGEPIYALGESPLGNVIADAQLAATDDETGAVAAFMNPGGVRADLNAGPVTYEEAFTVQPFANNLVTLDLTGAQLYCMLEQQFQVARRSTRPPRCRTRSTPRAPRPRPVPTRAPAPGWSGAACTFDGTAVLPTETYRVTVNNFLAGGGDGFSVLTGGTNQVTGPIDLDAFTDYLGRELAGLRPGARPDPDHELTLDQAGPRHPSGSRGPVVVSGEGAGERVPGHTGSVRTSRAHLRTLDSPAPSVLPRAGFSCHPPSAAGTVSRAGQDDPSTFRSFPYGGQPPQHHVLFPY